MEARIIGESDALRWGEMILAGNAGRIYPGSAAPIAAG